MGSDYHQFLLEASRVLKVGGRLDASAAVLRILDSFFDLLFFLFPDCFLQRFAARTLQSLQFYNLHITTGVFSNRERERFRGHTSGFNSHHNCHFNNNSDGMKKNDFWNAQFIGFKVDVKKQVRHAVWWTTSRMLILLIQVSGSFFFVCHATKSRDLHVARWFVCSQIVLMLLTIFISILI